MFIRILQCSHSYCDFCTKMSVIFKCSVILTRTNVMTTLTTVIATRRVWCWHVWVRLWHSRKWLWHSYVSKPHSACRNHYCVWCSHAYCDEHTHECNFWTQSVHSTCTSVIYMRRVRLLHTECNFYTQSVISTRKVWLLHAVLCWNV
jgi:hypothetical protein